MAEQSPSEAPVMPPEARHQADPVAKRTAGWKFMVFGPVIYIGYILVVLVVANGFVALGAQGFEVSMLVAVLALAPPFYTAMATADYFRELRGVRSWLATLLGVGFFFVATAVFLSGLLLVPNALRLESKYGL